MISIRLAIRELRQGGRHFAIFLASLVLGVMVITGVGTMREAVDRALYGEAKALLGGDMELSWRGVPPTQEQVDYLYALGSVSEVTTLRAMLRYEDTPLLVEVKAVDEAYPLYGTLKVKSSANPSELLFTHKSHSMHEEGLSGDSPLPSSIKDEHRSTMTRQQPRRSRPEQPKETRSGDRASHERAKHRAGENRSPNRSQQIISGDSPLPLAGSHKIIVDPIILARLDAGIGDVVKLGQAEYVIADVLVHEPDRVMSTFALGPRVMLSYEALAATGLMTPQTLATYRFRLKIPASVHFETVKKQIEQTLKSRPPRIQVSNEGNEALERFLEQLTVFLILAGLCVLLIGGIGIGNAVRVYLERKAPTIATMKTLGASRGRVFGIYAMVLLVLTLVGSALGAGLSAVLVRLLAPLVSAVLPVSEMALSWQSALLAGWYGILIVYLFSLPALVAALGVRPAALFRGMAVPEAHWTGKLWLMEMLLLALLLGTLAGMANGMRVVGGFTGVAILAFLLFGVCTWLVKKGARKVTVRRPWLRLALGNLHRPGAVTGTVLLSIGSTMTVFIALLLAEANFQSRITEIVEAKAPSLFLIDIQPDQQKEVQALLREHAGAGQVSAYPMVRGRIVKLNGKPVAKEAVAESVQWAIRGDRGFSYSAVPPKNANIEQGQWWPEDYTGAPQMSVDARFLPGMGLELGDTVTLDILGEAITATVTSARRIDYATFQINFAMMLSPGVLEEFPQSWVATVHLEKPGADCKWGPLSPSGEGKRTETQLIPSSSRGGEGEQCRDPSLALMRQLAKDFPNVTVIRTVEAIATVKEVLGHIGLALRVTVGLCMVSGVLVLASALGAMLDRRLYDTAILKVLGASRREIVRACTVEWLLLALVASGVAVGVGTLGAYLIVSRFPGEQFFFLPEVIVSCIGMALVAVWLIGILGNRQVFSLKPARLLRNE